MEVVLDCIRKAMEKGRKTITFLIDSNGGADESMMAIRAAMQVSGMEFTGLVMGKARSNGFNLLQLCTKRQALAGSGLVFHFGWWKFNNAELVAMVRGDAWPVERAVEDRTRMMGELAERSGQPIDFLLALAQAERELSGNEAKQMGFVDEILDALPAKARSSPASG